MVAPKGPGHIVRRQFTEGKGVPALIAGDARRGEAFIVNVKDHELVSSTEIVKSDESLSDKINISLNFVYTFDTGIS